MPSMWQGIGPGDDLLRHAQASNRDFDAWLRARITAVAATSGRAAIQGFNSQAAGLSIEEPENVACGDDDDPLGGR